MKSFSQTDSHGTSNLQHGVMIWTLIDIPTTMTLNPPTPAPTPPISVFTLGKLTIFSNFFHSARQYILVSEFSIFMGREEGIGKV